MNENAVGSNDIVVTVLLGLLSKQVNVVLARIPGSHLPGDRVGAMTGQLFQSIRKDVYYIDAGGSGSIQFTAAMVSSVEVKRRGGHTITVELCGR